MSLFFTKKAAKFIPSRRHGLLARVEPLEPRVVLNATFTQGFGFVPSTGKVVMQGDKDFGKAIDVHSFQVTFAHDAGVANLTYNSSQFFNGMVHIPVSGIITGPVNQTFHAGQAELDIILDGTTTVDTITTFSEADPKPQNPDRQQFTQGFLLPASSEGSHSISLLFKNLGNNESITLPLGNVTIDITPPSISSLSAVPATNTTPVDGLTVTLNKAIDPASFDFHALSLTRDGSSLNPLSAATITPVDANHNKFVIAGLSAYTNMPGNYALSIDPTKLVDLSENKGTGASQTVNFGEGTAVKAIPTLSPISPTPRNTPVAGDTVSFAAPVDTTTFGLSAISLKKNNVPVTLTSAVTISPMTGNASVFTISGLSSFTSGDGTYVLSIDGTKVKDANGQPGTGVSQASFTVDTVPPVISNVSITGVLPYFAPIDVASATLSKNIITSTFNPSAVSLTYRGVPVALNHLTVAPIASSQSIFTISGLKPFTQGSGNYVLTVDPSAFRDAAGNPGTGGPVSKSFTILGPKVATVGPVTSPRLTPADGVPITFSGPILTSSFLATNITLSRDGVPVPLPGLTVTAPNTTPPSNTTSSLTIHGLAPFTSSPGIYVLSANVENATDAFGTPLAGGGITTFVVKSQPSSLASVTVDHPNPYFPLNTVEVTFTNPINPGSFSIAALSLFNGKTNIALNNSVTITRIDPTHYQVSNLAPFAGRGGNYTVAVSGATIFDIYNQNVLGTVSTTFTHLVGQFQGGPAVTRIQRTVVPNQATNIVVTFNHALELNSATNVANYALFTKPTHGRPKPIIIGYASYNADTHQVTLYTSVGLAVKAKYQLYVFGAVPTGVTDTSLRPLTGQILNPSGGGTFVGTFGGPSSAFPGKKK